MKRNKRRNVHTQDKLLWDTFALFMPVAVAMAFFIYIFIFCIICKRKETAKPEINVTKDFVYMQADIYTYICAEAFPDIAKCTYCYLYS